MTNVRAALGIDIGGTFTDIVLACPNTELHRVKILTTQAAPDVGVMTGVLRVLEQAAIEPEQIERVVHGTTLATNIILERRGVSLAFVTTAGFRSLLSLGHSSRSE